MPESDFKCVICAQIEIRSTVCPQVKNDAAGWQKIVACNSCGHVQLHPPTYSLEFYKDDGQVNNVLEGYGTPFEKIIDHSWVEAQRRFDRLDSHQISGATPHGSGIKVLDIGGGYGFFGCVLVQELPDAEVLVMEPSQNRIDKGRSFFEAVNRERLPDFETGIVDQEFANNHLAAYDLITSWHVLEHVEDPVTFLSHAYEMLKPGGALCIEVPNLDDELMTLSPAFRFRSFMTEHISYFSKSMLEKIAFQIAPEAETNVMGYQRYGIFNYFNWVYYNKPLGKDPDLFEGSDRIWVEAAWRAGREASATSDALYMTIRRPLG